MAVKLIEIDINEEIPAGSSKEVIITPTSGKTARILALRVQAAAITDATEYNGPAPQQVTIHYKAKNLPNLDVFNVYANKINGWLFASNILKGSDNDVQGQDFIKGLEFSAEAPLAFWYKNNTDKPQKGGVHCRIAVLEY